VVPVPDVLTVSAPPGAANSTVGPVGDNPNALEAVRMTVLDPTFMPAGLPIGGLGPPVNGGGPTSQAFEGTNGAAVFGRMPGPAFFTSGDGFAGQWASAGTTPPLGQVINPDALAPPDLGQGGDAVLLTASVPDRGLTTTFLLGPSSFSLLNQPAGAGRDGGAEEPVRRLAGIGVTSGPAVAQAVGPAEGAGEAVEAPESLPPQGAGLLADLTVFDLDALGRAVQDLVVQVDRLGTGLAGFLTGAGVPLWLTPLAAALAYEVVRRRRRARGERALTAVEAGIPTWWFPGLTDLPCTEQP
jgi:hypothetical protein